MVIADFRNTDMKTLYAKTPLCQYDVGQHLNILGLDINKFHMVKFITSESITFVSEAEEITDGYRVDIPNEILSESGHYKDYYITAHIIENDGAMAIYDEKIFNFLVKFVSDTETHHLNINNKEEELIVTDDGKGNVIIISSTDNDSDDGNVIINGNIKIRQVH
jgi:hypothetical protein